MRSYETDACGTSSAGNADRSHAIRSCGIAWAVRPRWPVIVSAATSAFRVRSPSDGGVSMKMTSKSFRT